MDYEKKYKEALERAKEKRDEYKRLDGEESFVPSDIEYIFPELKESEDERMRKELTEFLKKASEGDLDMKTPYETFGKWLAWLEKQGEQKRIWSEEDEIGLSDALWCCEQAASIAKDENDMGNLWCAKNWLKSLKDRIQL